MPATTSVSDSVAGYLAEHYQLGEYIRHTRRERDGYLAFSLAGSGLVLGLLMRSRPPRSCTEACFLVGLAAGVALVAERMTIRATRGLGNVIPYLRIFVEPEIEGLGFNGRYASFRRDVRHQASTAGGLSFAYLGLTAAFLLAWFAAPVEDGRQWWQTAVVGALTVASLVQIANLRWLTMFGAKGADERWAAIQEQERRSATNSDVRSSATSKPVAHVQPPGE
jgi:hypothetical protein